MAFFIYFVCQSKGSLNQNLKPVFSSRKVFCVILGVASHPSLLFSPETVVTCVSWFLGTLSISRLFFHHFHTFIRNSQLLNGL